MKDLSGSLFFASLVLILGGCANQKPPSGGPIDTTPPKIIAMYPSNNSLFFHGHRLNIEFDKYVDQRSFEESIFISPYIGNLEFNWSGREVEVDFSEKLRDSTTYVVNIGTDIVDLNNHNRMAHSVTLAFATGGTIDKAGIEGMVFPIKERDPVSGIMIFAYRLDGLNPDTLNPTTLKPDFITQTGNSGDFSLSHLPYGVYRLFAVKDEYRNLLYDPEIDEYGVCPSDLKLSQGDTLISGITMKMAKEDTTGPRLIKIAVPNNRHIEATFSESVDSNSCLISSFKILDTLSFTQLKIHGLYDNVSQPGMLTLLTEKQDSTKAYRLIAGNVHDIVGNAINPLASSMVFTGSSKLDTNRLRLSSISIRDSITGIPLIPEITLTFSDAADSSTAHGMVQLVTTRKDTIPLMKKWISANVLALSTSTKLTSLTWYTLRANMFHLRGWNGRSCSDSLKTWRFQTLDSYDLSSIDGQVINRGMNDRPGIIYVSAISVKSITSKTYTTIADQNDNFSLKEIDEGYYVLQSFQDYNKNGRYDAGKPYPYIQSEVIGPYSDTLKVRARWPFEGVKLKLHR